MYKINKLNGLLGITREYCSLRQLRVEEPNGDGDYEDIEVPFEPKLEKREDMEDKQVFSSLEIKPVISMEDSFDKPPNEILLAPPFSMLFIAKPGSGKTTTLINLLNWYKGYFDSIIVISPTIGIDSSWVSAMEDGLVDIKPENILNRYDEAEFVKIFKKIKSKNKGVKKYSEKLKVLFIFDDIVGDMPAKKRTVINNFARNHRHYGISHITLSQEYNAVPPVLRKNSYGICFYDSDNGLEREAIIRTNMGKIGRNRFTNMWNDCCSEKFSFLFVKPFEYNLQKKFCKKFDCFIDYRKYDNKKVLMDCGDIPDEKELKEEGLDNYTEEEEELKEEGDEETEQLIDKDPVEEVELAEQNIVDNGVLEITEEDEIEEDEGNLDKLVKELMKMKVGVIKEICKKNGIDIKKKKKKDLIKELLEVEDLQI